MFKKLDKKEQLEAIDIADTTEPIEGYFMGYKSAGNSAIIELETKDGKQIDLWTCFDITSAITRFGKLKPELMGCFARFTFLGIIPIEGTEGGRKEVDTEVDFEDKHPVLTRSHKAKDYILKPKNSAKKAI